jgi:Calcineurin-like phosphoesterase
MPAHRIVTLVGRRRWRVAVVALAVLAGAGLLAAVPTTTSAADDIVVVPAADATVRADAPTTNFGTATTLRVDGDPVANGYLKFDVTGLTGAPFKVLLRVFTASASSAGVTAASVTTDWTETGITFANAPPPGPALGGTGPLTAGTYASIDVTSAVTGDGTYGFALSTTSSSAKTLHSREGANPPQLVITAGAPPPGDTEDATVRSDQPTANFGTDTTLRIDGSPVIRSYVRLPVTGLTEPINSAILQVFSSSSSTSGTALVVKAVSDNTWSESTITFNNAPPVGALLGSTPLTAGSYASVDVSSVVTGNGVYSFALETTGTSSKTLSSREGANPPRLVIETGPPGAVVAAAGDIACSPDSPNWNGGNGTTTACHQRTTSDLVLGMNPNAVFALGDEQYPAGTLAQFNAGYDPTWGRFKNITRPVVGNHEYDTSGASGYFNYFGDAATPLDPGCRSFCRGYYSFDLGEWHVVVLNSNCSRTNASCTAGGPQHQWLVADLAAHPRQCTMAIMHHAYWGSSSAKETRVLPFINALYNANADVILAGHAHLYERFAPQDPNGFADPARGIREFIVGTGGGDLSGTPTTTAPNSEVLKSKRFGVLRLTLASGSYSWRFAADPTTPFIDSGSGACH